jgi:hypothetical protein
VKLDEEGNLQKKGDNQDDLLARILDAAAHIMKRDK